MAPRRPQSTALTRLGAPLRGDHPQSVRDWCRYLGADWHWELWADLDASVRDARTAYERRFGTDFFTWFGERPHEARAFDAAMRSFSSLVDGPVVEACDLRGTRTVVDIAGGSGALLAALLRANVELRGTLFDQEAAIDRARDHGPLLAPEVRSRAAAILERIGAAARRGARLLLIELLIAPGRASGPAHQLDLAMLVLTGGRERTAQEFCALLVAAGFDLRAVRRTASPMYVLEAIRR